MAIAQINYERVDILSDTVFDVLMGEKPHDIETTLMVVIKRVSQDTKISFENVMKDIQTIHDVHN